MKTPTKVERERECLCVHMYVYLCVCVNVRVCVNVWVCVKRVGGRGVMEPREREKDVANLDTIRQSRTCQDNFGLEPGFKTSLRKKKAKISIPEANSYH